LDNSCLYELPEGISIAALNSLFSDPLYEAWWKQIFEFLHQPLLVHRVERFAEIVSMLSSASSQSSTSMVFLPDKKPNWSLFCHIAFV
jgi:hypothetical protein